jgi:beta-lactamase regulating signal transducer with metallopeptidase domain
MLYVAGAVLLLTRLAVEQLTIRRLARRAIDVDDPEWRALFAECARSLGLERPIRLLRSRDRTMPMTFGTRRPVILLPSIADTWSADRRRAVLLHELAHVARFDCLTQLLAALACAVYWMHPGVWWVARRLRVERELACDDRVLVAGTQARDYAGHLLEIAYSLGGSRAPALVVSMARPRQLEGRMLAVLDETRNRSTTAASAPPRGGRPCRGLAPSARGRRGDRDVRRRGRCRLPELAVRHREQYGPHGRGIEPDE